MRHEHGQSLREEEEEVDEPSSSEPILVSQSDDPTQPSEDPGSGCEDNDYRPDAW